MKKMNLINMLALLLHPKYLTNITHFILLFFQISAPSFSQDVKDIWKQLGSDIDGEAVGDYSGLSVSMSSDGTKVAIGATYNDGNGSDAGHVRVYRYVSSNWSQIGADIYGEAAGDNSGWSVSMSSDGTIVAIGAYLNNGNLIDSKIGSMSKSALNEWVKSCLSL